MATEQETAYSAGLFDGEGSIHIGERTAATLDGVGRMKGPQQILAPKHSAENPKGLRLLDLFCGAGGAAEGYHRAGFERILGIDIADQPGYPFNFYRADALDVLAHLSDWGEFDAIHASPPCQRWIGTGMIDRSQYPDLLTPARPLLEATGLPWVIENVPGAPLRADVMLCGSMFGLGVRRHRAFETSWRAFDLLTPCDHSTPAIGVYGHPRGANAKWGRGTARDWRDAMGIYWMTTKELSQAIPPAYTERIGAQLLGAVGKVAA